MAKYEQQTTELKNQLASARNILIALPTGASQDKLAAGLALYLVLTASGKQVSIISESAPTVSNGNLFGVGQITNSLPKTEGGNLTLTLEGVVASDGTVPALEKLDWFPQGANLNLVFHVLSGQQFQPARIVPSYSGGGFNMIITVGASSLNALGSIYSQNQEVFSGVSVVNIDSDQANSQFGSINVVDPSSSSLSEIVSHVILGIGVNLDADTASNLLNGIYASTNNLTANPQPDTFLAVSGLVNAGGKIPGATSQTVPSTPSIQTPVNAPQSTPAPVAQPTPEPSPLPSPISGPENYSANFAPLNQVFGFPVQPEIPSQDARSDNFAVPQVVNSEPSSNTPSTEERPMGEYVGSSSPEIPAQPDPDWLTPKVFKGTNLH